MSRSVHLHPLVTLFFGSLFGALGVLLSLPLVILVWTVVQVLWVERAVGVASQVRPVVRESLRARTCGRQGLLARLSVR